MYIEEVYKPCVSGLFLDDIRLATCPVESHRVGLSDASHNTLDTQPLFKFFLMSSDSEALFDTLMNELIHQMSGQAAPLGNGRPRDFPATDPAPDSTLLIVYSLLIIESTTPVSRGGIRKNCVGKTDRTDMTCSAPQS